MSVQFFGSSYEQYAARRNVCPIFVAVRINSTLRKVMLSSVCGSSYEQHAAESNVYPIFVAVRMNGTLLKVMSV